MKKIILSLILIGAALVLIQSQSKADDPLAKGKAALAAGNLPEAISQFLEATKDKKTDPQGFLLLADAYVRADSLDQAIGALVQARELDTANAQIYTLLGDVYNKQKIYAGAAEQYAKSVSIKRDPAVYLKLGYADKKRQKWTDAASAFLNVVQLDSNNILALREVGSLYFRGGQWLNGLPVYEKIYKLIPDTLSTMIQYVKVLYEFAKPTNDSLRWQQVIDIADSVLKRDGTQSAVELMQAEALFKTKQTDKVIKVLGSKNLDSLSIENLIRLAKAYKANKQEEKAVAVYQKAFTRDTTRCDIFYEYGTLLMQTKHYDDAIDMFDRKIACDTSSGYQFAGNLNIAMCLMQMKQYREAKSRLEKSIQLRPNYLHAWLYLGENQANADDVPGAIKAYTRVIELAKEAEANGDMAPGTYTKQLLEAYLYIGSQHLLAKEWDAAIPPLKEALKLKSDCGTALQIAQAYHNQNKLDTAKEWYCRVLKACPTGKEADVAHTGLKLMGEDCK